MERPQTAAQQPAKTTTTTALATKPPETVISYVPLGETDSISLTLSRVKQFLCVPTRSGKMPTDEQVVKFMMLCKAQSLNPWVSDGFLVGYDGKDGPQFSLITAHQALLKRAEASPEYDGMESGVVVMRGDDIKERPGDLVLNGEILVGGWARVHRRDRKIASYDSLALKTFDTGRSRWAADPAGQIVKCSEASALRKAFPSTLAAMYCKEEMERNRAIEEAHADAIVSVPKTKTERLIERLLPQSTMTTQATVSTPTAQDVQRGEDSQEPLEPQSDASIVDFWKSKIDDQQTTIELELQYPKFDKVRGDMAQADCDAIEKLFADRMTAMTK